MTKPKPLNFDAQDEKVLFPSIEGGFEVIDLTQYDAKSLGQLCKQYNLHSKGRGGQGYLNALREFSKNPTMTTGNSEISAANVVRKNHLGAQITSKPPKRQTQLSKRRDALTSRPSDTPGVLGRGVDLETWISGIDRLEYELCATKGLTPGTYTNIRLSPQTRIDPNFKPAMGTLAELTPSTIQTTPGPSSIVAYPSINLSPPPISQPPRSFVTTVPLEVTQAPLFRINDSKSSATSVFPTLQPAISSPTLLLRLAGNQCLNISHTDIPATPIVRFGKCITVYVQRLASIWDDNLISWNPTYCPVVVRGVPIAAKYWPKIFKHSHRWSHAFRTLWLSWSNLKLLNTRCHDFGKYTVIAPNFAKFMTFCAKNGKTRNIHCFYKLKMTIQRISRQYFPIVKANAKGYCKEVAKVAGSIFEQHASNVRAPSPILPNGNNNGISPLLLQGSYYIVLERATIEMSLGTRACHIQGARQYCGCAGKCEPILRACGTVRANITGVRDSARQSASVRVKVREQVRVAKRMYTRLADPAPAHSRTARMLAPAARKNHPPDLM
ncbi:hypothetical protein BDP27DRAFT_1366508 [Rhodocollybia butyracea]|uniref:SAP domain-containing protein n=1 Tax=Rhodocollybia butyracea TaxID=206335 RepID=A0A9P5U455_9AGAR|nr:hypothetical protein BDP27DRAFT_1366508 [Rhodocollybia butyracea]